MFDNLKHLSVAERERKWNTCIKGKYFFTEANLEENYSPLKHCIQCIKDSSEYKLCSDKNGIYLS